MWERGSKDGKGFLIIVIVTIVIIVSIVVIVIVHMMTIPYNDDDEDTFMSLTGSQLEFAVSCSLKAPSNVARMSSIW